MMPIKYLVHYFPTICKFVQTEVVGIDVLRIFEDFHLDDCRIPGDVNRFEIMVIGRGASYAVELQSRQPHIQWRLNELPVVQDVQNESRVESAAYRILVTIYINTLNIGLNEQPFDFRRIICLLGKLCW